MKAKHLALAAVLTTGLSTAAHADEHMIVLTGFSYFPAVTYVVPGDTVVFINESGEEQTVVGKDAGWVVGPLTNEEEGVLVVTEETELKFFAAYQPEEEETDDTAAEDDEDYGDYEDAPIRAEITFETPPLSNG